MKNFYLHPAQGQDKAYALREAKLDYLQRSANSSPVYLAPFTLSAKATGRNPGCVALQAWIPPSHCCPALSRIEQPKPLAEALIAR